MPNAATCNDRMTSALVILGACGAVLLAGGATLWAYYGSRVFFDMLASGLAYCF